MAHASDCNKPTHRPRVARVYALALLLALTLFVHFSGQLMADDAALVEVFARSGVEGTTVISSLSGEQTFIYNEPRAHQRFSPASTFKIPNTLISLEEQAIAGEDAVFEWDGQIYEIPNWNHDQTLESAFKVSCVWCFQQLAIQVGGQRFRAYLHELDYGELSEPFSETTFWLDGSLTISATEQVEFLKKLYRRSLPFSASAYETLRAIMLVETTADYSIWAKTGWATRVTPKVGWYVGYIETRTDRWFFATNIVAEDESALPLRQRLTREALQAVGVLDADPVEAGGG